MLTKENMKLKREYTVLFDQLLRARVKHLDYSPSSVTDKMAERYWGP